MRATTDLTLLTAVVRLTSMVTPGLLPARAARTLLTTLAVLIISEDPSAVVFVATVSADTMLPAVEIFTGEAARPAIAVETQLE